MGDTWNELTALKTKRSSLREKLARRQKERNEILVDALKSEDATPDKGIILKY